MLSNQITRSIIKSRFNEQELAFYDKLPREEKEFIQLAVLSQPRALQIDISFPKVIILLSQLEFGESDEQLLDCINSMKGNNLEIRIYLDEIIKDKNQPDYVERLEEFDLKKHRHEDYLIFKSELYRWQSGLRQHFLTTLSLKLKQTLYWNDLPFIKILENLNCFNGKCDAMVLDLIKILVPNLSLKGKLLQTIKDVDDGLAKVLIDMIVALEPEHGFVLGAFSFSNEEEVEFLLSIMDASHIKKVDILGNTPLHLVNTIKLYPLALATTPDINQANIDGDTALHRAVNLGEDSKVGFLLLKGARTDIKNNNGETCWTIDPLISNPALDLYKKYAVTGCTISFFYLPVIQTGLCCGLYAAAFLINYYVMLCDDIQQQTVVARKCDLPDSNKVKVKSLRMLAKEKGITQVGEILSMDALAELINNANCPTELYHVENYEAFISVLQKASMRGQPVIIPYGFVESNIYDGTKPIEASKAHLATCIGVRCDYNGEYIILLAHQGGCQELKARELYYAFFNIPETIPTLYFYKVKGEWQKYLQPQDNLSGSCRVLNSTSLSLFRRRLLVGAATAKTATQISSVADENTKDVVKQERSFEDQDAQLVKRAKRE